jgi:hypothetical protein
MEKVFEIIENREADHRESFDITITPGVFYEFSHSYKSCNGLGYVECGEVKANDYDNFVSEVLFYLTQCNKL